MKYLAATTVILVFLLALFLLEALVPQIVRSFLELGR